MSDTETTRLAAAYWTAQADLQALRRTCGGHTWMLWENREELVALEDAVTGAAVDLIAHLTKIGMVPAPKEGSGSS